MLEIGIVIVIVAVVVLLAGRSLYRTMTGKNDGCSCAAGTCRGCAHESPEETEKIRGRKP